MAGADLRQESMYKSKDGKTCKNKLSRLDYIFGFNIGKEDVKNLLLAAAEHDHVDAE